MRRVRCLDCGWPQQTVGEPCFVCGVDVRMYPREDDGETEIACAMRQRAVLSELGLYLPLEVK